MAAYVKESLSQLFRRRERYSSSSILLPHIMYNPKVTCKKSFILSASTSYIIYSSTVYTAPSSLLCCSFVIIFYLRWRTAPFLYCCLIFFHSSQLSHLLYCLFCNKKGILGCREYETKGVGAKSSPLKVAVN